MDPVSGLCLAVVLVVAMLVQKAERDMIVTVQLAEALRAEERGDVHR